MSRGVRAQFEHSKLRNRKYTRATSENHNYGRSYTNFVEIGVCRGEPRRERLSLSRVPLSHSRQTHLSAIARWGFFGWYGGCDIPGIAGPLGWLAYKEKRNEQACTDRRRVLA